MHVPACPGPFGVPFQVATAQAVNAGTLRAGCRVGFAP
jgi:hypothetical protein